MQPQTKKTVTSIGIFVVFFCIAFFGTSYLMKGGKTERKLKEAAEEINKNAPAQIDAETRLDSASVDGETLQYYFTLPSESVDAKTFDAAGAKEFISKQAQKNYDESPQMNALRELDATLHYFYRDGQGKPAFDFSIKPKQK